MKGRPGKKYSPRIIGEDNIRRYFEDLHDFPPLPDEKLEMYFPDGMLLLTDKASYQPYSDRWTQVYL